MATASIPQSINRSAVARALRASRVACQNRKDWLNAVNRAALNLEACGWIWTGETLVIASATDSSTRYRVTADACECLAYRSGRRACWHRAALRLLLLAAEVPSEPEPEPEPPAAITRCPMCDSEIIGWQYYVGDRGYMAFDVCSGDGVHVARKAA